MKYLITIQRNCTYSVEAQDRNEAYRLARTRKATPVGIAEEAITIERDDRVSSPR